MTQAFTVSQVRNSHHVLGPAGELVHIFEPYVARYSSSGVLECYHQRDSRLAAMQYAAWKNHSNRYDVTDFKGKIEYHAVIVS